jgi:hypothetical protein
MSPSGCAKVRPGVAAALPYRLKEDLHADGPGLALRVQRLLQAGYRVRERLGEVPPPRVAVCCCGLAFALVRVTPPPQG